MGSMMGARRRELPYTDLPRILVTVPGAILVVAVLTAELAAQHVGRTELILPFGSLVVGALIGIALHRFEWFLLTVLAIRTMVDFTKLRPAANPTSAVVQTNNGSSGSAASALAILFIAAGGLWLLAQHRAGRRVGLTTTDAAFAFFVLACVLSVPGAVNRTAALTETARVVAAVMMFIIAQRVITTMKHVRRVLIACFVSLVPPVALGGLQVVTGSGKFVTGGVSRVVGTFLHPNTFGFFLAMFMLMAIAMYRHSPPGTQLLLSGVVVVCGGMLVLTYSRGAWVAFVLGLLTIGALQSRRIFAWLIGGAIVVLIAVPSVVSRVSNVGSGNSVTGSTTNSLTWRFTYWSQIIHLNSSNPVTGIGLKGTRYLTDQSKDPHNDFLRAYVETGVVGLLGYLLILFVLVSVARAALRHAQPGLPRGIAVGFAAVLVAYVADSFSDNLMSEVVVLWYFYALAACAVVVARLGGAPPIPPRKPPSGELATAKEPAASAATTRSRHRRIAIA